MAESRSWTDRLTPEDLSFIRRFVLASGSLKAVAAEYGISYPTVRLRLDRLIEKIRIYESLSIQSDFERHVRALGADGRIGVEDVKRLLELHEQELQAGQEIGVEELQGADE